MVSKSDSVFVAETRHAGEISKLVNSAYRGESSKAGWTTEADFLGGQRTDPASLEKVIEDPRQKIICLRNEEGLLGCVNLKLLDDSNSKEIKCYLGLLTVKPNLQNAGIGKKLMELAEEEAREWQARKMTLRVIHLRSELIAWYERQGYKPTGQTEPFPYEDPLAGKPLRDDLHFVCLEKKL